MTILLDMLWIELHKAVRSKMPLFTALGSLFISLGIGFLLYVSRNPEISRKLGLISTKANLISDTSSNWPTFLGMFSQMLALVGLVLFVIIISWVFGREFTDGTLKDLLAVPIDRTYIVLAKFILVSIWSAALAVLVFGLGLVMGVLIRLPQGSPEVIIQGSVHAAITTVLVICGVFPFAFLASLGRGYLLPIGGVILTLITANLAAVAGWGETFPWAAMNLYAQGKSVLPSVSFLIIGFTGLIGMAGTWMWWKYADQNR